MPQTNGNVTLPIAGSVDNRIKPYGGLSHQRLTDLLNRINSTQRVEGIDFNYGTPVATVGVHGENTVIRLTPMAGTHYGGPADVYYTRLSLEVLDHLPLGYIYPAVISQFPFWIASVLPQINLALGLDLLPSEVQNIQYNAAQNTYELRIVEGASVAWKPSVYYFQAIEGYDLSSLFHRDYLGGFDSSDSEISDIIVVSVFAGFDAETTDINTLLSQPILNGFDPSTTPLTSLVSDHVDGFDWQTTQLESLILVDKLNGFDWTQTPISSLLNVNKLDGFNLTPNDINNVLKTVYDGFDEFTSDIGGFFASSALNGFDWTTSPISAFQSGVLNGFDVPSVDIAQFFTTDKVDGFDWSPTDISTKFSDTLDGFNKALGVLDTTINTVINGFDLTPGNIADLISSKVDGFDLTPSPLAGFLQDKVDGFDAVIIDLNTILQDKVAGFGATPEANSPLSNLLFTMRPQESGWSGTKISSFVSGSHLVPDSQESWDMTPSSWDEWSTWDGTPYTRISYSQTLDMGAVRTVRVVSDAAVATSTSVVIEYSISSDGINYTTVLDSSVPITTRYINVTLIATGNDPILYSAITNVYGA